MKHKHRLKKAAMLVATFLFFFAAMLIAELGGGEQGVRTLVSWVQP